MSRLPEMTGTEITRATSSHPTPAPHFAHDWPSWARGTAGYFQSLAAPAGRFFIKSCNRFATPERLDQGLVLILPGIEAGSFCSLNILWGLLDAQVPMGLKFWDWTTGYSGMGLHHLCSTNLHEQGAEALVNEVVQYRQEYPGRPIWIIGHSGGTGIASFAAVRLPESVRLTGIVMLGSALSRDFDLTPVLSRTERGIWSFYSPLDWFFLRLATSVLGSIDRRWGPCGGGVGFRKSPIESTPPLRQICFKWANRRDFNFGGHRGATNRVFVNRHIAPILGHED